MLVGVITRILLGVCLSYQYRMSSVGCLSTPDILAVPLHSFIFHVFTGMVVGGYRGGTTGRQPEVAI